MQALLSAEIFSAIILLASILGVLGTGNRDKSTKFLLLGMAVQILCQAADVAAYTTSGHGWPDFLLYIINYLSYVSGAAGAILFMLYSRAVIEEHTSIPKAAYHIPLALTALIVVYLTVKAAAGQLFLFDDGVCTQLNPVPPICTVFNFLLLIYLPVPALRKRKQLGTLTVCTLSLYSVIPLIATLTAALTGGYDYTLAGGGLAYLMICILLQNRLSFEKQKQYEASLTEKNEELAAMNEEQAAQVEEISSLNTQLQENQAQLEESSAEQEAQLEETQALNAALQETKDQITAAFGVIQALSREYHTIWVVDKETMTMRLVRSSGVSTIQNAVQLGRDTPDFDDALGKYIDTYVEPEDRERMHREIAAAEVLRRLEEDSFYSVNYLRRDDSGRVGYHQIAFANADAAEGVKQFVYGFRDIDALVKADMAQKEELQKAKTAAESANNAKTAFLFNMSHDIRTPMNAIMGFRDLLEKYQDDPARRADYLAKIKSASDVLLSIINNVLEMARIEKGTLEIAENERTADQVLDSLYLLFREMMQQKNIEFTRQLCVQHERVYCDPVKLREVFINILGNAYKYTNPGGRVNLVLEEVPSDREGYAFYRTTISDTGIGMSEEFLPHIFEEFSRENNTTDNKIEGTGLGMPITKRLVELMGGTIEVRSKKGEGTTFIVTVPHRIAEDAAQEEQAEIVLDPSLFEGKRILLAEDNDLNAEIAMEILGEAGFITDRAEDGKIACEILAAAEAGFYDVVLMDIQMPNMNGYEAARAVRSMPDPARANIPILAMTANAFEEDRKNALDAGMDGHVAKPIDVTLLMKTLAAVLARK